jgi:hypothetical protein
MGNRPACYVFGVTPAGTTLPSVIDATPLATTVGRLSAGEIGALVSPVPLDEMLGDDPQDPAWLLPRVEAHDRVLTAVAAVGAVVPFRFGVVFGRREAAVQALTVRSRGLLAALRQVGDSQEWTVSIDAGTAGPARTAPAGRGPGPPRPPARPGQGRSYLLARGAELAVRDRIDDTASAIGRRCREWHIPAVALPPSVEGICRLACLIPRTAAGHVVPRLAALTGIEDGVRVAVLGPLPPYHFVDPALG